MVIFKKRMETERKFKNYSAHPYKWLLLTIFQSWHRDLIKTSQGLM